MRAVASLACLGCGQSIGGPISAKMVRTSSMTMPSMVGIVGRAPAVDEKVPCSLSVCLFVTLWN